VSKHSETPYQQVVVAALFRFTARSRHDLHGSLKVRSVGGFSTQHDSVGSVVHRIRHIRTLGTGGARIGDHAFQHLRSRNDGFSRNVRAADHHLLGQEHLAAWNFHAQISAGVNER